MKKLISIALVLSMAAGVFVMAGCGNEGTKESGSSQSAAEPTTVADKKTATAKISKFEAYVHYDPDEFKYDEDLLEIFSKTDEDLYLYGAVFDETEIDREKQQFETRAEKTNLTDVNYGEIKLDNFDAKTVTYKSNGNYSKEYFIVFDKKIGEWSVGAKIYATIGDDKSSEAKMDEIAKTLEIKEK